MKELDKSDTNIQILPKECPICGCSTVHAYCIHETRTKDEGVWYHCQCGVVFQDKLPEHDVYNAKYLADYIGYKESKLRGEHAARTYAPLIEESTYGRMLLDVGYNTPYVMDYFEDRGWLVWGIDLNKDIGGEGHLYRGSFETYDFQPKTEHKIAKELIEKGEIKRTFDVIWMGHVFEHFADPVGALRKAYNLLSNSGLLFIATPDIDFIYKSSTTGFVHWKKREHYIMWNTRSLVREMKKVGFDIVMKRRNFSSRFISWFDLMILAQKHYF